MLAKGLLITYDVWFLLNHEQVKVMRSMHHQKVATLRGAQTSSPELLWMPEAGHPCCEEHEALLGVQEGIHFRSPLQLNNSGFPPGPINSFNFAWTVVSRVLYPQELLWTVRGISTYAHPMSSTSEQALRNASTSS